MISLNLILAVMGVIFSLVCIFLGVWLTNRTAGKLKKGIIFLNIALFIIIIKETLKLYIFLTAKNLELIRNIMTILIIFFILLAILSMKQMINKIDYNNRKRKK